MSARDDLDAPMGRAAQPTAGIERFKVGRYGRVAIKHSPIVSFLTRFPLEWHMSGLELPSEIERRLDAIVVRTGRSRTEHLQDAILEHIENLEDATLADERLATVRAGAATVPLSELLARHGVDD